MLFDIFLQHKNMSIHTKLLMNEELIGEPTKKSVMIIEEQQSSPANMGEPVNVTCIS